MRPLKLIIVVVLGLLVISCSIYALFTSLTLYKNKPSTYYEDTEGKLKADVVDDISDNNAVRKRTLHRYTSEGISQQHEVADVSANSNEAIQDALHKLIAKHAATELSSKSDFDTVVTLSLLLPHIKNITRMPTPSTETFLSYIAPTGLPVIFTDMLVGTNMNSWSWDYVKERWGNEVFHNTRQGNYSTRVNRFGKHIINRVSVKLGDFIDIVTGKREPNEKEQGLYITKQKILPTQALEDEFCYPPFYTGPHKKCFLEPTGWIGAPGTFTQGHIDSKDNFVYQLIGKKRWIIYPPYDYYNLYYKQGKGSLDWSSVLSQKGAPDLDQYPLYSKTNPITFVMNPGEVLYLPRGWTHFVENVTPSLMINTWRRGPAAITETWIEKNREEIRRLCLS